MKMLAIFCSVIFLCNFIVNAKDTTLKVVVLDDFPPLYVLDKDKNPSGFALDIIKTVGKNAGYKLEYIVVENWAKAMQLIRDGKADLIPGIGISETRKKEFLFSEEIETIPVSFFVRSSNYNIHDIDDFKGKKIGVIQESAAYTRLRLNKNLSIKTFPNIDQAVMHLLSGKIDLFVFPRPVLRKKIRLMGLDDKFKVVGRPLMELKRGFLYNKKSSNLQKKLDKYIREYIDTREYKQSYFKWYGKPDPFWDIKRTLMAMGSLLFLSILGMILWRGYSIEIMNRRLEEEKSRFKVASQVAGDILYEWNVATDELNWLGDIDSALGYKKGEISGNIEAWLALLHPKDQKKMKYACEHHRLSTEPISYEYKVKNKDGTWKIWYDCASPIVDDSGKPEKWIGRCTDISELVYTQKELREREQYLTAIKNSAGDAIYVYDDAGGIVDVNMAACRMLEYDKSELLGMNVSEIDANVLELDEMVGKWREMEVGSIYPFQGMHIHNNGEKIPVEINYSVVVLRGERHIMGLARDQREKLKAERDLRNAQEQLFQSQKMESIGHLAGGIAHDFNNILAGIIGLTELSIISKTKDDIWGNLTRILGAAERAKNLVAQILSFSRQSSEITSPVYLKSIIQEVADLLRASLPSSIEIQTSIIKDKKPIIANATKVHEVVMNLCTNAAYAMGGKGILEIIQEERVIDYSIKSVTGIIGPGEYSVITIRDTGHGIKEEDLSKIFEPYYTTKPVGEGTGLGLAVVFGIVQNYGGSILVQSEEGIGTEFQILFPQVDSLEDYLPDHQIEIPRGNERILFVDDEKELCDLYKRMLTNIGYNITVFTNSIEALDAFQKNPEFFDLVITDQTMPKMAGIELAQALFKIRRDIPVILCSGYSKDIDHKSVLVMGIKGYCEKPIRMKDIALKIREVLTEKN